MPPNPTASRSTLPLAIRETLTETAAFEAEPYDLVAEMPKFDWPTVVISGGRDLITPPAVAERIASLVPERGAVDAADHGAQRAGLS